MHPTRHKVTHTNVRREFGVTLKDITRNTHYKNYNYGPTQQVAKVAREQGYNAILAPSAQNSNGINLVLFYDDLLPLGKHIH
ncbi:RES family NAD+ phosphorylase [Ponticaulis sp.]|uniref:RES family NAD+ phosphorylase n=1 Tax=Ponticaulis sp. TaxID=2020902 RepID=UPI003413A423